MRQQRRPELRMRNERSSEARINPSDVIARPILFIIGQPYNVDVSEIIVRPTNER